jgi:hypothetical protein
MSTRSSRRRLSNVVVDGAAIMAGEVALNREVARGGPPRGELGLAVYCPFHDSEKPCVALLESISNPGNLALDIGDGEWYCFQCRRGGWYEWIGESDDEYSYLLEIKPCGRTRAMARIDAYYSRRRR